MKRSKWVSFLLAGLVSSTASAATSNGYCAAIRGNGELMPAHWGAMSSIVEEQGLPQAMAGGSSASITMFLLESLSLNPHVKTNSEKALMIKSFQGYFEALSQTPEGKALQSLLADKAAFQAIFASAGKIDDALKNPAAKALLEKHLQNLKTLMGSKDMKGLINPDFVRYVERTMALASQNKPELAPILNYRSGQISHAIKNFGKFDAQTDKTLFFRPGLIHFEGLAQILGKMADFYASYNNNSPAGKQVEERVQQFLALCTPDSKDLTWAELNEQRTQCRQLLGSAVLMYQALESTQSRAQENIGSHIPAFATTSVITGPAVDQFAQLYVQYQTNTDENFGDGLSVAQEDMRFGYWGASQDLTQVENKFSKQSPYKSDAKSQRFLSLGETAWSDILAASPAEPGLSRIVALNRQQLSAGGWSDYTRH